MREKVTIDNEIFSICIGCIHDVKKENPKESEELRVVRHDTEKEEKA